MSQPLNPSSARPEALLRVDDLWVEFFGGDQAVRAVRGLTYEILPGEAFGLVGESGSGKTVSALALLGLLPAHTSRIVRGSVRLEGSELVGLRAADLQKIRGSRVAIVPQDPHSSLNPVLTVGRQIAEVLEVHRGLAQRRARRRAVELLSSVGIPDAPRRVDDYPHQFSGGMRQRAIIAMALACEPSLLIADEPTTALDVTIQAQILALLHRVRSEYGMAVLLITHDLGVVAGFTDRIGVMYAGRIVETGPTEVLLTEPAHPYTAGLLQAIPRLDRPRTESLIPIPGSPPDLRAALSACPFAPRCAWRIASCWTTFPQMEAVRDRPTPLASGSAHDAACHNQPTASEAMRGAPDRAGFAPAHPPA